MVARSETVKENKINPYSMYEVGSMLVYFAFKAPSDCESLSKKKKGLVRVGKICNIASH